VYESYFDKYFVFKKDKTNIWHRAIKVNLFIVFDYINVACFVMNVACFVMNVACFVRNVACFVMNVACFVKNVACFITNLPCLVIVKQ